MGPPPRSFAADAHDCIMVRLLLTYRIQVCGAMIRVRKASSPLIVIPTTMSVPARAGPVKARPGSDGACRQGRATAGLDSPCARRPPPRVGRGEETGFQVEQRNGREGRKKRRKRKKERKEVVHAANKCLTSKAPYKSD